MVKHFMCSGCNLLALCAAKNGTPSSLYSIMRPLGKWWTLAVDINIVLQLFGTAVAYLLVGLICNGYEKVTTNDIIIRAAETTGDFG